MNRTTAKAMLIDALNQDLPDGVRKFLSVPLPKFTYESMDEETSLSWQGNLAKYLCNVFTPFEGLFPVEIPLRIGQKNATMQGLLIAALKATREVGFYYSDDIIATATALSGQIEALPSDVSVEITQDEIRLMIDNGRTLKLLIDQEGVEVSGALVDSVKSLFDELTGLGDAVVEEVVKISAEANRNMKSLVRSIYTTITGGGE